MSEHREKYKDNYDYPNSVVYELNDKVEKLQERMESKILSERNPYAKTAWITVRNTHGKNRLQVVLELDGEEDILEDTWVPCLDDSECLHLQSHQVTNLFKGRDEEIHSLKKMIIEVRYLLQSTSMIYASKDAYDFYEKTKEIKVD